MLRIIFIFSFLTSISILYQIIKFLSGKQKSISRLKKYTSMEVIREEKKINNNKEIKIGFGFISKGIGNVSILNRYKKKIQIQLARAHILLKPEEFITTSVVVTCLVGTLAFVIVRNMPLTSALFFAVSASIFGWFIPTLILKSKTKKRLKYLNEQLCDAITLISNSLKAGYSFFQSVEIVSKEMTGPISEEFSQMQKEINLGLTTEKALENLVARVLSDDLELVVTAVLIQRQVGGNLSEVLDNITSTIRERLKIKRDVKTLTAQGRMSATVIAVLPPALGVILFLINPEQMGLLFKNPLGIAILGFSAFMEFIGIVFIKKAIKVEF